MEPMTGMMIGSLALSGAGLGLSAFGGKGSPGGYSKDDLEGLYRRRAGEIDQFSTQLGAARAKYQTQLNNFYGYSYGRYMPQAEAQYAGRGLQVSGGAFASALAKKAADFQNQGMLTAAEMERGDLTTIAQMRGQNAAAQMGAGSQVQGTESPYGSMGSALGQMGGQMGNMAFASYMQGRGTSQQTAPTTSGLSSYKSTMAQPGAFLGTQGIQPSSYWSQGPAPTTLGWKGDNGTRFGYRQY